MGTDHTSHIVTHNLGIKPDHISVLWDDGRMLYDIADGGGSNYSGWMANNVTATFVGIWIFRYAVGYFYVTVSNLSGNNFDFS